MTGRCRPALPPGLPSAPRGSTRPRGGGGGRGGRGGDPPPPPPASARTTVVLDPHASAGLFASIVPALHADNVLKGKSLFAARAGKKVASQKVRVSRPQDLVDHQDLGLDHRCRRKRRETVLIE